MAAMDSCCSCWHFKRLAGASAEARDSVFFDAEEGTSHHDHLFLHAYRFSRKISKNLQGRPFGSFSSALDASRGSTDPAWYGTTMKERLAGSEPSKDGGAEWSRGDGLGFQVRGSCKGGRVSKIDSTGAFYECISSDILRSTCKVGEVMQRLLALPPQSRRPSRGEASGPSWTPDCPLPRVLCLVAQLPDKGGSVFGEHPEDDAGCSIVTLHVIKPETLRALQSSPWPASLQLFVDFVKEGRTDVSTELGGSRTSGLMKAVAAVGNLEEIGVPRLMLPTVRKYNGKPCLITKSGTVFKDPAGEWLEINIDVRRFCYLARSMLVSLRDLLPKSTVHCGFTIQGCNDDELPEGIVCDLWLHNVNLLEDPRSIDA